jgi:hypothetical protein
MADLFIVTAVYHCDVCKSRVPTGPGGPSIFVVKGEYMCEACERAGRLWAAKQALKEDPDA